jgi:hypothetical protein
MDTRHAASADVGDEAKIRAAALDYIAGVLENDPTRTERALHPELSKCAYLPGLDGKPQLSQMSALALIQRVGAPGRRLDPSRHAEVVILDRYEGAASVEPHLMSGSTSCTSSKWETSGRSSTCFGN